MTDVIANMCSIIKNGYLAKKKDVEVPYSILLEKLAMVLSNEGYIGTIEVKNSKEKKVLSIILKYNDKSPVISNIQRVSKPGLRVYVKRNSIPHVLGGIGKVIISTSSGLMTGNVAKKKGVGGEIICKIW